MSLWYSVFDDVVGLVCEGGLVGVELEFYG